MSDMKAENLAQLLAKHFNTDSDKACACVGCPPCDDLGCPRVWEYLLKHPDLLILSINIMNETNNIRNNKNG